ncbi:metallophosphoesterase family protein [Caldinitratiruptor microaerophilus]|uniref:Calcineurin-like phosphoesterase domain-containing protein n=1 Tax=Caldinitratiruptor microaerophilus TaxID=671077 RepID=A0AA35CJG3_9FIRM|nr:metallophosphoesterase [Caldinitratiruptor microaerophilus]BDG59488.1 hypothetical protein caldi_05780 [Caldinitratiruptor microaerophilus]
MRPVKIVHCADVHLDASFAGAGLTNTAAKLRAEELKDAFARIVGLVRSEEAGLFLIAGDLFEHEYVRKSTVQFVIDRIARQIPDVPVFIAPGNHDPYRPDSYYATLTWPPNVTIFGPRWERVHLPQLGVTVHGWGFDREHVAERRLAELRIDPEEAARAIQIVVLHGSDERVPAEEDVYLPLSAAECQATGADYIALGHFHGHHVVATRPGAAGPLAAYPGSPESLSFGQSRPHGVLVGTVGREGNDLRLVAVGQREHLTAEVDVTGAATLEDVLARVEAAIPAADRARHLYRVTLTGEVDPDLDADPAVIEARLADRFYSLTVRDRTAPALDLQALAAENSLRGHFVREVLARLEGAAAGEAEELRLALRYGLQALAERR